MKNLEVTSEIVEDLDCLRHDAKEALLEWDEVHKRIAQTTIEHIYGLRALSGTPHVALAKAKNIEAKLEHPSINFLPMLITNYANY